MATRAEIVDCVEDAREQFKAALYNTNVSEVEVNKFIADMIDAGAFLLTALLVDVHRIADALQVMSDAQTFRDASA